MLQGEMLLFGARFRIRLDSRFEACGNDGLWIGHCADTEKLRGMNRKRFKPPTRTITKQFDISRSPHAETSVKGCESEVPAEIMDLGSALPGTVIHETTRMADLWEILLICWNFRRKLCYLSLGYRKLINWKRWRDKLPSHYWLIGQLWPD
jgi:hypothetical protein